MSEDDEIRDDPLNESEGAAEEDMTPEDAPAEPAHDRTNDDAVDEPDDAADEPDAGTVDEPRKVDAPAEDSAGDASSSSGALPRTTTTGDDEQDYRQPGDGAVSGIPGDDVDDSGQRH